MPKIRSYHEMDVVVMQATLEPQRMVGLAQAITMKADLRQAVAPITQKQIKFLLRAEHSSLLEHVIYTFYISGVSRSFLAQITRQRTASPTSGSQHYQDYSDYDCVMSSALHNAETTYIADESFKQSFKAYGNLVALGVPKEEARQVLPNAASVNYLWTIDARNLYFFLRQRLCHRNVEEMQVFSERVLSLVRSHFPELFDLVGPQCFMGGCKQGFLKCSEGLWVQP